MEELKLKIVSKLRGLRKDDYFNNAAEYRVSPTGIDIDMRKVFKDVKISEEAKNRGNDIYFRKNHDLTSHFVNLRFYNVSVAYAPNDSEELAIAYGNRSALLRHIRKYSESILEADKAMKITNSTLLQVKLLCRKAECHTALGSSENRNCIEKARFLLGKSNDSEITKKVMNELIIRTQSVIDADQLDKPKVNKKKIYALKMTEDAEKKDVWSSVKMEFSKKHGKHLAANRDFEPGEIILVEKPYFNHLHESVIYSYCCHCFEYLWNVVPCNNCAWRLYCSEDCKNEAWDEYHDLECPIILQIKGDYMIHADSMVPFTMGIFLKALKEAGSVSNLQNELNSIDKCKDECKKGFSSDGKFEGYKSIYAQPLFKVPASEIETYSCTAALALVGLAKYTNILGENYNGGDMRLLVKNKVAVFVGALMLKFCLVIHCRRTSILIVDPSELIGGKKATIPENPDVSTSIKSLGFMNITACAPNIHNFLTYGNKYFVYAVQPIKKGASFVGSISSIYHNTPRSERQATYMKYYGAPCKCQACTENWLEIIQDESKYKECARSKPLEFSEILEEMEWIEEEIKDKKHKLNNIDVKLLSKARNLVAKSWRQFPLPTYITARTISVLMAVYNTFFFPLDLEPERTNSCTK